jgi:hypothetical protein
VFSAGIFCKLAALLWEKSATRVNLPLELGEEGLSRRRRYMTAVMSRVGDCRAELATSAHFLAVERQSNENGGRRRAHKTRLSVSP